MTKEQLIYDLYSGLIDENVGVGMIAIKGKCNNIWAICLAG